MKRLLLFLALVLIAPCVNAQYLMLSLNPDSRSLAMGGTTAVNLTSSQTIHNNPSLVSFAPGFLQLSTSYYSPGTSSHYYTVSGYVRFGGSAVQAAWRHYDHAFGEDMALDLAFSQRIARIFSVGITGRYLHLKDADGTSVDGLAADLSASCQIPMPMISPGSSVLVGAKLANLGGYLEKGYGRMPIDLTLGAGLDWWLKDTHRLFFSADVEYCFTPEPVRGGELSLGVEYEFMQLLQLRAGYHLGERDTYRPSYVSLGAGLSIMHLRVDFTYLIADKDSYLNNVYSLQFGLDF